MYPLDKSLRAAALEYAARGWPVFPCKPGLKTPLTKNGVLDATTNPAQIDKWWSTTPDANIGLDVGGAGMMVLDYDPGFNLEELEQNVGPIPDTQLRSRTPRGGEHCYLSIGHDEYVPASSSKLASHVDVRSFHSYVLLPPSQTKDGSYNWIEDGTPAFRSERLLHATATERSKSEDRDEWIIEPDLSDNVRLATTWLREEAKPAVEGQGGDHCAYATAAMLKSYGISPELAFDLMLEHWNPRCIPPWFPEEIDHLQRKVENAYAYNTSPPGNMTPEYRAQSIKALLAPTMTDLPGDGDETNVAGFRFADRAALKHVRPPEWIIDNFIPDESYAMIFGSFSTFKTFLALDMALTVACEHDRESTLWTPNAQGPVLFMAGEGRSSIAKRVKAWEQVHNEGQEVADFVLVDPVPLINITEEYLAAFIKEALRRHPDGYYLTFVDTLGKSMAGTDENAQQSASAFTLLAQRLHTELGGSVVALHHSGHSDKERARGSSLFPADTDTQVRVDRPNKAMTVSLAMTKQKEAPEWAKPKYAKLSETLVGDSTTLVVVKPDKRDTQGAGELIKADASFLTVLDRALEELLRSNPTHSWTQGDLAEALAMNPKIDVPSKSLQDIHLKRLREDSNTMANRCYDPMRSPRAGRWRWCLA